MKKARRGRGPSGLNEIRAKVRAMLRGELRRANYNNLRLYRRHVDRKKSKLH